MNKYEALGRYTETQEMLEKAKKEREMVVDSIYHSAGNLQRDLVNERTARIKFTPEKELERIKISTEKLEQIQQQIIELSQTLNHYADFCDRPKI
ncbi:hypothetical protein BKG95_03740 [Rodentibacter pneumotropicus]|uniref:hypothetical protein n=1 Tax=Rodentibacter pneumotropicus TaxID=758 RepID=UPI0009895C31|nr:hypothetical protein [Rodentibacter pneumotropicus]OOF68523.1 hypothetical protein BKG95_03740 [Rodentibacter pneumotropicus]THA05449.1 hypothetical protein D3M73_07195 [Rodentibacter pneumotropicus]